MRLLYFVTLLMVEKCGIVDVKLLFNMIFYHFIHGMMGSAAEWYADPSFPKLSGAPQAMSKIVANFACVALAVTLAACEPRKGKELFSETVASNGLELRIRVFQEGQSQNLAQGQHYQIECRSIGGSYTDSQWRLFDVGYMVDGFNSPPSKYLKVLNSTTAYSNLFGFVATFDGCKSYIRWSRPSKVFEGELVNPVTPNLIKEVEINDRAVRLLLDPVAFRSHQRVIVSLIDGTNNWRVTVNGDYLMDVEGI